MGENAAKKRPSTSGRARKRRPALAPPPRKRRPLRPPTSNRRRRHLAFRSSASARRPAGSRRSPSCSRTSPPTAGWRSCSSSTSIPPTPASCAKRWPRRRRCRSARPRTACRSSPTTSTSSRRTPTSASAAGRLTLAPRSDRGSRLAPADRLLLPLAGRRARQPRHRRGPVGHRLRRHRGAAGDQGRGRHHLRAGSAVGEVRRHAAQRDQRRRRRLLPAASPSSPQSSCA